MKKLSTRSIYWLTFSRIVNGDIRLIPSAISELLIKPVPPYSYKQLSSWFNENLAVRSQNTSFIDRFSLGPDKKPLSEDRRKELKLMYLHLLNNSNVGYKERVSMNIRYVKDNFHIPLNFDALFRIGKVENAFVRYLFAYSDPQYIAKPHEIDVLLTLATTEYPRQLRDRYSHDKKHFLFKYIDEKALERDSADYEFWALRFSAFQYDFHSIKPARIEKIAKQIQDVVEDLDSVVGKINMKMLEADQEWNSDVTKSDNNS